MTFEALPESIKESDIGHTKNHNSIHAWMNLVRLIMNHTKNSIQKEAMINIYPIDDYTRIKLSFWSKKENVVGNQNFLSIETHGNKDTYHLAYDPPYPLNHVTFYSVDENGKKNKVMEWRPGTDWNNIFRIYPNLQVDGSFRFGGKRTIVAPNSGGFEGDFCYDDNYLYICISNNSWKRVQTSLW